jgi:selenocysteine lyase/cysteine desulfurase
VGLAGPRARARRAHIYVLDLPPEQWVGYLAQQGVRVSPERDGVRVSFGVFNTPDDVDRVAGIIAAGLQAPASA